MGKNLADRGLPMKLKYLKNLGPVSAKKLEDTGIRTEEQLRRLGAVKAYLRVKQTQSGISLNLLYALHGALTGVHWSEIGADARAALLLEVDAREALSADDPPVSRLNNIGKALSERLAGIGVLTRDDLVRTGPVDAYLRMQARSPFKLPVCYNLYALEGALRGCHWNALPDAVKGALYQRAKGSRRPRRARGAH